MSSSPEQAPQNAQGLAFTVGWWALLLGFLGQVALGYSACFFYDSALWAWHRQGLAQALWDKPDIPAEAMGAIMQLAAMLGATISCWAVAMLWIVAGPLKRREPWALACIVSSTYAWGLVDTLISAQHGFWLNVAFNLTPMVMISLASLLCWASLRKKAH